MENKINIAELLKDCPQGMELDCAMWNDVVLESIEPGNYPVKIRIKGGEDITADFTEFGEWNYNNNSKCVIFPKGKTTWEGFVPPCLFKDGDIVVCGASRIDEYVSIFKIDKAIDTFYYHAMLTLHSSRPVFKTEDWALSVNIRLATEEEKKKLFQAINDNGYKWNADTKTLEKLIKPKFKVGDRVRHKTTNKDDIYEISKIYDDSYGLDGGTRLLYMKYQDQYELVPDKFNITTLKPFSKVLMRSSNAREWDATFYSHYNNNKFYGCGMCCDQCIPYEGNEHLIGTTNDCNEFYKIWE